MMLRGLVLLILLLSAALAAAQDAQCPSLVDAALNLSASSCAGVGGGQACYGNVSLDAVLRPDVTDFSFDSPGDVADLAGVESLTLSSMDSAASVWGVALMKVQANLPETLPGQLITFVLFGDVEVSNAVSSNTVPVEFPLDVSDDVQVYSAPDANSTPLQLLRAGDRADVIGRIAADLWLRVRLDDGSEGWVKTESVETTNNITLLDVYDETGAPGLPFNPMQAFYFRTGVGDAACVEAPGSGMLIQTPQGAGELRLMANEVEIVLGSTIYLQAVPGAEMIVRVVEGQARVSAFGVTVDAPAGTQVQIPLDQSGKASSPPVEPEPYSEEDVQSLPVILLTGSITVAPPLEEEPVPEATDPPIPDDDDSFVLVNGTWRAVNVSVSGAECDPGEPQDIQYEFEVTDGGETLNVTSNGNVLPPRTRVEENVYTFTTESDVATNQATMTVDTPSHFMIVMNTTSKVGLSDCQFTWEYTLLVQAS